MSKVAHKVDFHNTALAFQAMSDSRLRRTHMLYRMIDNPFLTKVGPKMLTSALKMNVPIQGLVRSTLFELFVGGESLRQTARTSERLYQYGIQTVLDYSVEGEKNEEGFDGTQAEILDTIAYGGKQEGVAFSALKMTGLASFDLMAKLQSGETLSDHEVQAWQRVRQRLEEIAQAGAQYGLPFFIDAEESWIQQPIDDLALDLMNRYNQARPLVWMTLQHYRHDRLNYLRELIEISKAQGFILGVKLVRGAYLEKEGKRAKTMGYPTPIQPNKAATDRDYNDALNLCVEHIDHVAVCAGTHNEHSSRYLTQLMDEKGLPPSHPHVWFSQLLGMSDHITFNLAEAGYNATKYLPYGPVKAVMPYLMRRAEENTAIGGQSSREVELLNQEMKRRGLR